MTKGFRKIGVSNDNIDAWATITHSFYTFLENSMQFPNQGLACCPFRETYEDPLRRRSITRQTKEGVVEDG